MPVESEDILWNSDLLYKIRVFDNVQVEILVHTCYIPIQSMSLKNDMYV
jgi:hypothetical protein